MKNIRYLFIVSLVVLTLCGCDSSTKTVSDKMKVNFEGCSVLSEKDTHGGFLGDGEYFLKMNCSSDEAKEVKSKWKEFPLREDISEALEMSRCDDESCLDVFDRYDIPEIENGYYYLLDRHSEAKDNQNADINGRASYNFSLGMYDIDNDIVYFYELDT